MSGTGGRAIVGLIMIVVLFVMFPLITDTTHDLQTDDYVQTETGVTTGAGETSYDVVLTEDLWQDEISSVLSITSTEGTDSPAAGSYTAATNTLTVTGLAESLTRDLTITYEYDGLESFTGMGALVSMAPMLILFAIIAIVIGSMWTSVRGHF